MRSRLSDTDPSSHDAGVGGEQKSERRREGTQRPLLTAASAAISGFRLYSGNEGALSSLGKQTDSDRDSRELLAPVPLGKSTKSPIIRQRPGCERKAGTWTGAFAVLTTELSGHTRGRRLSLHSSYCTSRPAVTLPSAPSSQGGSCLQPGQPPAEPLHAEKWKAIYRLSTDPRPPRNPPLGLPGTGTSAVLPPGPQPPGPSAGDVPAPQEEHLGGQGRALLGPGARSGPSCSF